MLVAQNPFVAAKFFHIYLNAFFTSILQFDPKGTKLTPGVLGAVKGYYGRVEAQGRGTLHCHMLIWLEGAHDPVEIRDRIMKEHDEQFRERLIAFLDDVISNSIPPDPGQHINVPSSKYDPCSVRALSRSDGADTEYSQFTFEEKRKKDLHNLAKRCQVHIHSPTCYKYCKPGEPRECRVNLDSSNVRLNTTFNEETGNLCLRCLDGLVNNFNETILEAMRCNMDIRFVGSGEDAKAVIYYITSYITKSQLKAHVAYAALDLAAKKLGDYDPKDDDITVRAKRLLQKCAYSMLSHQELSGQQVASYLMDYGDHYTSDKFQNLFWTSFENFIEKEQPSPECYNKCGPSRSQGRDSPDSDVETNDSEISDADSDLDGMPDASLEDVTIARDSSTGQLIAKAQQVLDYQLRPEELKDMNVWDYLRPVHKERINTNNTLDDEDDTESESGDLREHDADTNRDHAEHKRPGRRPAPRYSFLPSHPEYGFSQVSVRKISEARVPVPIGPPLPRRDRPEIYERYCRAMLVRFKPWRHAEDLRNAGQKWSDAFREFERECNQRYLRIMRNMQILHECKDSGSDHFEKMRRIRQARRSAKLQARRVADDFGPEDLEEILNHIQAVTVSNSQTAIRQRQSLANCMDYIDQLHIFADSEELNATPYNVQSTQGEPETQEQEVSPAYLYAEDVWRLAYENRRAAALKRSCQSDANRGELETQAERRTNENRINDGTDLREALLAEDRPQLEPSLRQDIMPHPQASAQRIPEILREYTLNEEQARAFKIIAEHSLNPQAPQLKMYLGGAGGTGKSRVLQALTAFFRERGESRRLRLASYTGVAAKNIDGMTIHAALCLNQRKNGALSNKAKQDLVALWSGVDYFFIDEVSMIGCGMLTKISDALIHAKGTDTPFGGVNMIFAGDFAQLPPVGQTRLTVRLNAREMRPTTKRGQENIAGKLLWNSVDTVILKKVMRQAQSRDSKQFTDLLARLREGRCSASDYQLLNTRLIENVAFNWDEWIDAPIIVSDDLTKDALNEKAAMAFAKKTGQPLHWYYASDTHHGRDIDDPDLKNFLETSVGTTHTEQRLGPMPLVIGMPVMICQNYDVEGGVVNGCIGKLKKIHYYTDASGKRHATSCVIESPAITCERLPNLQDKQAVVLQDTVDLTFTHPFSVKRCVIQRTQLPLLPAFAITAHKSPGQTLEKAMVDLDSCRGSEAPYVMISRVKSLQGLLILRPFLMEKIQRRLSQDTRKEMHRLEIMRLRTIVRHGDDEERRMAREELESLTDHAADQEMTDPVNNELHTEDDPIQFISLSDTEEDGGQAREYHEPQFYYISDAEEDSTSKRAVYTETGEDVDMCDAEEAPHGIIGAQAITSEN